MHSWRADGAPRVLVQLSNTSEQPLIVQLAGAGHALEPFVEAAWRHIQTQAHQAVGKLIATMLNRLVPQDESLAKNVAASRKKSRPFFMRASSRLSRATSTSRALPAPPKAFGPSASDSCRQRVSKCAPIPSSWATWAQLTPGCRVCSTAPRLNSALNFLLFEIEPPFAHYRASLKRPGNRGRTAPTELCLEPTCTETGGRSHGSAWRYGSGGN